jgi:hypothetical protein
VVIERSVKHPGGPLERGGLASSPLRAKGHPKHEVRNPGQKQTARCKKTRTGLETLLFFVGKRVERGQLGTCQNNLGNFLLLDPDFFFWRQRASAKGSVRAFFGGWCSWPFFFQLFFLISEGFQWGCFRSSKFQNLRAIS